MLLAVPFNHFRIAFDFCLLPYSQNRSPRKQKSSRNAVEYFLPLELNITRAVSIMNPITHKPENQKQAPVFSCRVSFLGIFLRGIFAERGSFFFFLRLSRLRLWELMKLHEYAVFLTVLMFFVRPSLQSYGFALWEKWFLPWWGMSYVTDVIGQSNELFCFVFSPRK